MKTTRFIGLIFLASVMAISCNSDEDSPDGLESAWNALVEWNTAHANFDHSSVGSKLPGFGMLGFSEEYMCRGGKPYMAMHEGVGRGASCAVFHADGTCKYFWYLTDPEIEYHTFYRIFNWSYDEATATISTWRDENDERRQAQVIALSSDRIVFDGNLCGNADHFEPGSGTYIRAVLNTVTEDKCNDWYEHAVNYDTVMLP